MRIGLLGGSFNPVHNAHLYIALEAKVACKLDQVIFIPAADPPHKPIEGDVSFEQRSEMVRRAISGRPDFEISTIEAERVGKSYTIDTIRIFRESFPADDLYFIIGGDSFLEIGTWHRYAEIFGLCNLIIVKRPGCQFLNPLEALSEAVRAEFKYKSETGNLKHHSGTELFFITGSPMEISSTEIRRLASVGADITVYLPQDVAAYISQQRIYTNAS